MRKRALCRMLMAATALLASSAFAKIDLVTLPARDATELTIYNSEDLTLVRETRTLPFTKGPNEIQFSWANTLIDPTSLQIRFLNETGLVIQDAVYPANTNQVIVWNIDSDKDMVTGVEISYFTSGLTWAADYVIRANAAETEFSIQQFTTVQNNSGEDFDNAKTRVVVGTVNLVETIAQLAQLGVKIEDEQVLKRELGMLAMKPEGRAKTRMADRAAGVPEESARKQAAEIIKKAVSEYYLFAVAGTEDIKNGFGKELPNPEVAAVPFDLSYEIDLEKYGAQVVKFYKLKNDTKAKLGKEPLPEGSYYVYSDDGRQGLRFEGTTSSKYVPVGEDIELNLGSDGLVLYEERVMSTTRSDFAYSGGGDIIGWDETRTVELELKNSRDREVPIKLTHHIDGDWKFKNVSNTSYKKLDQHTVRWEDLKVPANSKTVITYEIVVGQGSRAKNIPGAPQ